MSDEPFDIPLSTDDGNSDAYQAGFELGRVDALLASMVNIALPCSLVVTVQRKNRAQLDLLAMSRGLVIDDMDFDEGMSEETIATWSLVAVRFPDAQALSL